MEAAPTGLCWPGSEYVIDFLHHPNPPSPEPPRSLFFLYLPFFAFFSPQRLLHLSSYRQPSVFVYMCFYSPGRLASFWRSSWNRKLRRVSLPLKHLWETYLTFLLIIIFPYFLFSVLLVYLSFFVFVFISFILSFWNCGRIWLDSTLLASKLFFRMSTPATYSQSTLNPNCGTIENHLNFES